MAEPMGFFTDTTVCIGCKACEVACKEGNQLPATIGVNPVSGTAQKCTLCYDRMKVGLEPACAKACPTKSINFGTIVDLKKMAQARLGQLQQAGESRAYLYGDDESMLGGLNSFYLLVDKPQIYGLPPDPQLPVRNLQASPVWSLRESVLVGFLSVFSFRNRGRGDV